MHDAGFSTWRSTCLFLVFGFRFSHSALFCSYLHLVVTLHFLSFSFSCPFSMCTCVSFVSHSSVFKPVFPPSLLFCVLCSLFVLCDFLFLSSVLYVSVGFLLDFLLPAFCCLLFGSFVELFRLVFGEQRERWRNNSINLRLLGIVSRISDKCPFILRSWSFS